MGTNYYGRIIPSKQRKKELYDAIESNDFNLIKNLTSEIYDSITIDYNTKEIVGGEVHLGKRSSGWKFLWDPNVFVIRNGHSEKREIEPGHYRYNWIPEPSTLKYLYPLTKAGLKEFIDREDILIYNEYEKLQDKEEFWDMALNWGYEEGNEGWDAAGYDKEYPEHVYPLNNELTNLLAKEGYKFTSYSNSDFYSDGLRFASYTDFS